MIPAAKSPNRKLTSNGDVIGKLGSAIGIAVSVSRPGWARGSGRAECNRNCPMQEMSFLSSTVVVALQAAHPEQTGLIQGKQNAGSVPSRGTRASANTSGPDFTQSQCSFK
jgi:hypothetical protein